MPNDILTTKILDAIVRPEETVFIPLNNIDEINNIISELDDKYEYHVRVLYDKTKILTTEGNGDKYLADDGTYKEADTELSIESTNPVQNKAITEALNNKVERVKRTSGAYLYGESSSGYFYKQVSTTPSVTTLGSIPQYQNGEIDSGKAPDEPRAVLITNDPRQPYHCTNKKYVDDKFNGANKAVSFEDYETMISALNGLENTKYNVGQNVMIVTLEVPDLWVSSIAESNVTYTYTTDEDFANALKTNESVQVGYYVLSALETQKVDLNEYVKNTDYATSSKGGVGKVSSNYGFGITDQGFLRVTRASGDEIIAKTNNFKPIVPMNLNFAVKKALTEPTVGGDQFPANWTEEDKALARTTLGIEDNFVKIKEDLTSGKHLYGRNGKTEYMFPVNNVSSLYDNKNGYLPFYSSVQDSEGNWNAQLYCGLPQKEWSAANKKYVDDKVAEVNTGGSGGGSVTVDTELSAESTNPVQNKVVTEALDGCVKKYTGTPNTYPKLYGQAHNTGEEKVFEAVYGSAANKIHISGLSDAGGYDNNGNIVSYANGALNTAIPTKPSHATPMKWVEDNFSKTKLYKHTADLSIDPDPNGGLIYRIQYYSLSAETNKIIAYGSIVEINDEYIISLPTIAGIANGVIGSMFCKNIEPTVSDGLNNDHRFTYYTNLYNYVNAGEEATWSISEYVEEV